MREMMWWAEALFNRILTFKATVLKKQLNSSIPAILAGLILLFSASCKKESSFPVELKYAYFPTDSSHWVIYDVDSVFFDDFFDPVKIDSSQYQIKEVIESEFIDNEGRPTQRIERYKRRNDTQQWKIHNVWYSNRTSTTAERVEDNLRFIKLVFPLSEGTSWNGNVYVDLNDQLEFYENQVYEVTSLDDAATIGPFSFDSTVTITHIDDENLIEKKLSREVYAKNVGLVSKETLFLKKQNVTVSWDQPESGYIVNMSVHDYKK